MGDAIVVFEVGDGDGLYDDDDGDDDDADDGHADDDDDDDDGNSCPRNHRGEQHFCSFHGFSWLRSDFVL